MTSCLHGIESYACALCAPEAIGALRAKLAEVEAHLELRRKPGEVERRLAAERDAAIRERDEARALMAVDSEELSQRRSDEQFAAGELRVPIPQAGTNMARLLSANILLRRQLDVMIGEYRIAEKERDAERARADRAETERDEAVRLSAICICVYCKTEMPKGDDMVATMVAHIEGCEKHPIRMLLAATEALSQAEARAERLAAAAWSLSTWAASINWSPRGKNTSEWLDGLRERIESVQSLCSGPGMKSALAASQPQAKHKCCAHCDGVARDEEWTCHDCPPSAPVEEPDREVFCACGRRVSDCDGSRSGCAKKEGR